MRLQRVTVTVMCPEQPDSATFILNPGQIRVVYFPRDGASPHVIYLCPGCNASHRVGIDLDTLDQLRDCGAPSDWPSTPSDLAGLGRDAAA